MRAALALSLLLASASAVPAAQAQGSNPLSAVFGCQVSGGKQEAGAAVGAILGGVLGNQVAKNERGLGTVVGAALGAAAGSWVGCRMQSTDQARAQQATKDALDQGVSQSWSNPQTGASGRVDVISSSYGPPVYGNSLRYASGVQQLASYEQTSGGYYAGKTVNLRAGPSTGTRVVGKLNANEGFQALGKVSGQPWILVGRNGQAVGYVSEGLVYPSGDYGPAQATCRTIAQTISAPGYGAATERYNACKDSRGQWQLTKV